MNMYFDVNKACPWLKCQWPTINWQSHYPSGSGKAPLKVWVCVFMNHSLTSVCNAQRLQLPLLLPGTVLLQRALQRLANSQPLPLPSTVHSKCPEVPGCQWLENLCSTLAPASLYMYLCVCLFFISLLPLVRVQRPKPLRTWISLFATRAF